jgi:hypothetical protein
MRLRAAPAEKQLRGKLNKYDHTWTAVEVLEMRRWPEAYEASSFPPQFHVTYQYLVPDFAGYVQLKKLVK